MVELLALASRQVTSLSHVADEVDRLARTRTPASDAKFGLVLAAIEYELLPNGDDDKTAMLRVEWHPDKAGVTVVRTAYALL